MSCHIGCLFFFANECDSVFSWMHICMEDEFLYSQKSKYKHVPLEISNVHLNTYKWRCMMGTWQVCVVEVKGMRLLCVDCAHRGLYLNDNALTVLPTGIFDPLTKLTYVPLFPRHARVLGVEHLYQWHVFFRVL